MRQTLAELQNATVRPDGQIVTAAGAATGLAVEPGGHLVSNTRGQIVATLTRSGHLYDRDGRLVAQIRRDDIQADQSA